MGDRKETAKNGREGLYSSSETCYDDTRQQYHPQDRKLGLDVAESEAKSFT